jgi:hypothetical protein
MLLMLESGHAVDAANSMLALLQLALLHSNVGPAWANQYDWQTEKLRHVPVRNACRHLSKAFDNTTKAGCAVTQAHMSDPMPLLETVPEFW